LYQQASTFVPVKQVSTFAVGYDEQDDASRCVSMYFSTSKASKMSSIGASTFAVGYDEQDDASRCALSY
jgi:hypothetical protein